jgi:hypothetical protein
MSLITQLKVLLTDAANLGKLQAASNTIGSMQFAMGEFNKTFANTDIIEKRFKSLQTTFGLSIKQAGELGEEFDDLAKTMGIGGEAVMAIQTNLKGLIGAFAGRKGFGAAADTFGKSLAVTSKALMMNYRLSGDTANKYIELYADANEGLEQHLTNQVNISTAIEQAVPGLEITAELISDMASLSADTEMQFGRMPGQLELAVIKAKQLGINMKQLTATGDNLLNIESSIGQEMEYQLLSGRRLVDNQGNSLTNKYREAMLTGKSNDMAMTLNEILEKEGDTLRTNMFARKQMAELLNMDEATLARMLKKQEILKRLPNGQDLMKLTGDELATKLATLQAQGGLAAADLAAVMAGDDLRSTDEKLNSVLDQMTTTGIKTVLVSGYGAQAQTGSNARVGMATGAANLFGGTAAAAMGPAQTAAIAKFGFDISKNVGAALAGGGMGLLVGNKPVNETNPMPVLVTATTTGNDFASFGGGGRLLLGPEGAMSINNNDVVLGGTNLFGGKGASADVMQMAAAIVAAINNQTRELKSDPVFGRGLSNSYYG